VLSRKACIVKLNHYFEEVNPTWSLEKTDLKYSLNEVVNGKAFILHVLLHKLVHLRHVMSHLLILKPINASCIIFKPIFEKVSHKPKDFLIQIVLWEFGRVDLIIFMDYLARQEIALANLLILVFGILHLHKIYAIIENDAIFRVLANLSSWPKPLWFLKSLNLLLLEEEVGALCIPMCLDILPNTFIDLSIVVKEKLINLILIQSINITKLNVVHYDLNLLVYIFSYSWATTGRISSYLLVYHYLIAFSVY
jgi:hypothetical protein